MISTLETVDRLCRALDGLAHALESGKHEAVLLSESSLVSTLAPLTRAVAPQGSPDRTRLERRVADARALLSRCQILGHSVSELMATLQAQTPYSRTGVPGGTPPPIPAPFLNART